MATEVNVSERPSLEPIWTNYRNPGGASQTALRPAPSPGLSPSPRSPRSLPSPSPIYPSTSDGSMRRQDRALVNSLDQRAKRSSAISLSALTPIDGYCPSPLVSRLEKISILPLPGTSQGLLTPVSPNFPPPRGEGGNSRKGSGSAAFRDGLRGPPAPAHDRKYYATDRQASQASTAASPRRIPSGGADLRDQLRTWGHVYYGNAKAADAFIIARSLRQHNHSRSADAGRECRRGLVSSSRHAQTPGSNHLTVRAIVRPRALERPSFLLQRSFNTDELRATVPDPLPSWRARRASTHLHDGGFHEQQPPPAARHRDLSAASQRRRSSNARSGAFIRSGSSSLDVESLIRDAKAVPIHFKYARAFLPVIAALLVSGHVRDGDVIYLPMPHAEAWPQTARYVYTGQGELTTAMRENILYLAGKA
ncbi:hypothetical protein GGS23DRAFT_352675 [Durotheca rogersii]|uniref:uncharacterized protein n=1 Tax=Durotheca rogersii TaxID=419775 RepID=UPI00221FB492|nr:uncharacterized protein GGS23DRAFT_352675 [Durotheca rogersii]KAI5865730.1 hypothetical protein GGS23DRAFT_352675 [Durotheca rogersii]